MTYKDIINAIEPFDYSKYKDITSCEKLMLYATKYLEQNNVPLSFNYICIASFKMFPDKFCCDEEFKEFPSVDRLNRTMMHLKYVKNGNPFLTGKPETGYSLTAFGRNLADEVEQIIIHSTIDKSIKAPIVDKHKSGGLQDYTKFIESNCFIKYKNDNLIDLNLLWKFFKVIPYTQLNKIKKTLSEIKKYAQEQEDTMAVECTKKLLERI